MPLNDPETIPPAPPLSVENLSMKMVLGAKKVSSTTNNKVKYTEK